MSEPANITACLDDMAAFQFVEGQLDDARRSAILAHLKGGSLPLLTELSASIYSDNGPVLANALEARRELGPPPLARLGG